MIQCILFDIDGVLVNSDIAHYESMNNALIEHGYDFLNEHLYTKFGTISSRNKLKYISDELNLNWSSSTIQQIADRKFELLDYSLIELNFDVKSIFDYLKDNSFVIGLVTNAREEFANYICECYNIYPNIIVSNSMGLPGKPAPDMYAHAVKFLNSKPECTLVFEDSQTGVNAAVSAHCNVSIIKKFKDLTIQRVKNDIIRFS